MKILLLCDAYSAHSQKWIRSLIEKKLEIKVVTLKPFREDVIHGIVEVVSLSPGKDLDHESEGAIRKLFYLLWARKLKKIISDYSPDYLHAYYASSYGAIGALTGFHPFYISVWGSDVMSFPEKGFLHALLLKYSLNQADRIFATSKLLTKIAGNYSNKKIEQIPFGINTGEFRKLELVKTEESEFAIGSVKSLELNYGIDILIHIFAKLVELNRNKKLRLMLIGDGSEKKYFIQLVNELNISSNVEFIGYISHDKLPEYYNRMDIFANLSRRESFGVSVLEASACGVPVVVSDIDGLKEVFVPNETGISIDINDPNSCVDAIQNLILDSDLRKRLGYTGREFVQTNYTWESASELMLNAYS